MTPGNRWEVHNMHGSTIWGSNRLGEAIRQVQRLVRVGTTRGPYSVVERGGEVLVSYENGRIKTINSERLLALLMERESGL